MNNVKLYWFLLITCFYSVGQIQAQNRRGLDSLQQVYHLEKNDTLKIHLLLKIAIHYKSKPDSLLYFAQTAQSLSEIAQYPLGSAKSFAMMGMGYHYIGNFKLSLYCYQKALILLEKTNYFNEIATIQNNIGLHYLAQQEHSKALMYHLKALELYEKTSNALPLNIAATLDNIANIYAFQNDIHKALEFHKRAYLLVENLENIPHKVIFVYNLALDYWELKEYQNAEKYFLKCLSIYAKSNHKHGLGSTYNALSDFYYATKDTTKAVEYLQKFVDLQEETSKNKEVLKYISLADHYFKLKNWAKALLYIEKGYQQATIYAPFLRNSFLERQVLIYENLGQYQEAFDTFKKHKTLSDSLFTLEKSKEINQLSLEREELENKRLKASNELQNLQLKNLELIQSQQAQRLALLTKEAEAEHFISMAKIEKNKRKADSLYALAMESKWEAANLKTIDEKLKSENALKSIQLAKAQREKILQQRITYLILTGLLGALIFGFYVYKSRQKIQKAKQKIDFLNTNLEELVKRRTQQLIKRNKQLETFAFYNAHTLRRPIARLMGLYSIILETKSTDEKILLLQHFDTTLKEIDTVIHQVQTVVLNEEDELLSQTDVLKEVT